MERQVEERGSGTYCLLHGDRLRTRHVPLRYGHPALPRGFWPWFEFCQANCPNDLEHAQGGPPPADPAAHRRELLIEFCPTCKRIREDNPVHRFQHLDRGEAEGAAGDVSTSSSGPERVRSPTGGAETFSLPLTWIALGLFVGAALLAWWLG